MSERNVHRILDFDEASSNSVEETASILSPEELEEKTSEAEFENAMVFETSGTSGDPKRIPYAYSNLQKQREHEAKAFEIGGMTRNDVVMTLGAPLNSISGWASRSGSRQLGAEVLNRSFNDYEKVIEWQENEDVTTIFATPLVAQSIGEEIEEEYGVAPAEIFPEMKRGFMFGDLLPENLKKQLKDQWGFDELRSLYGTVEADVIAIEGDYGLMVPMLDRHVLEVRPYSEDGTLSDDIVDIREIDEPIEGSILISDTEREKVDITRYEIGDAVRVHPGEIPRLEVLGRTDNTINLGGAPLHENTIHEAAIETYGSNLHDWRAYVSRPEKEDGNYKPAIDIYVSGENLENGEDEFLMNLFERSPPVKEAYNEVGEGIIDYIQVHKADSLEMEELVDAENLDTDVKSNRIIFGENY